MSRRGTPWPAPAAVRHRFTLHTLDGAVVRAALLDWWTHGGSSAGHVPPPGRRVREHARCSR